MKCASLCVHYAGFSKRNTTLIVCITEFSLKIGEAKCVTGFPVLSLEGGHGLPGIPVADLVFSCDLEKSKEGD